MQGRKNCKLTINVTNVKLSCYALCLCYLLKKWTVFLACFCNKKNKNSPSANRETRSWKTTSSSFKGIRFAEEDLSEILVAEEIAKFKIPQTIPVLLEFIPTNVRDVELEEEKRARTRAQALADKSNASKEASHSSGRT